MALCLIIGGARSGKSAFAMRIAEAYAAERQAMPVLIATAEALDEEMTLRIAHHRAARTKPWHVIEEPVEIAARLPECEPGSPIVIDCITLWISNLILRGRPVAGAADHLIECLARENREVVLVTNEVGLGIVPDHPLGRQFRDEAGRINQIIAAHADAVYFMVAGLPLTVKSLR